MGARLINAKKKARRRRHKKTRARMAAQVLSDRNSNSFRRP